MSFPRYPKYKDSRLEWLGEVPEHWQVTRIDSVASLNDEELGEETDPALPIKYVDISSLNPASGKLSPEEMTFGNAPSRARRVVRTGDVIVSTVRTYLRAIAPIRFEDEGLIVSTGFAVVRPRSGLAAEFARYALLASTFIDEVISRSTGVSYPAINARELGWIKIPVPADDDEQIAIAAFIDQETAKIDALIEEQRRLIELLKEKRQAVISHRLSDKRGKWEWKRLRNIAEVRGGITKHPDNSADADVASSPYLRVANVQDGFLNLAEIKTISASEVERSRYQLRKGDVLMNEGGDFDKLGRGAVWNDEIPGCLHQNHVFCVRPYTVESEWVALVTATDSSKFYFMCRSKQSTNLASISRSNIRELPVPLPSEGERIKILRRIAEELRSLDLLETTAVGAIRLLQERRSALISAAVTGKIDLRNYAPQEDPAAAEELYEPA